MKPNVEQPAILLVNRCKAKVSQEICDIIQRVQALHSIIYGYFNKYVVQKCKRDKWNANGIVESELVFGR